MASLTEGGPSFTKPYPTKKTGGKLAQQVDKEMEPKDYDGGKLQQQESGAKDHYGDESPELHPPLGVAAGGKRKTGKKSKRRGKKNHTQKNKKGVKTSKK